MSYRSHKKNLLRYIIQIMIFFLIKFPNTQVFHFIEKQNYTMKAQPLCINININFIFSTSGNPRDPEGRNYTAKDVNMTLFLSSEY